MQEWAVQNVKHITVWRMRPLRKQQEENQTSIPVSNKTEALVYIRYYKTTLPKNGQLKGFDEGKLTSEATQNTPCIETRDKSRL
jgi:hypothetical protein